MHNRATYSARRFDGRSKIRVTCSHAAGDAEVRLPSPGRQTPQTAPDGRNQCGKPARDLTDRADNAKMTPGALITEHLTVLTTLVQLLSRNTGSSGRQANMGPLLPP